MPAARVASRGRTAQPATETCVRLYQHSMVPHAVERVGVVAHNRIACPDVEISDLSDPENSEDEFDDQVLAALRERDLTFRSRGVGARVAVDRGRSHDHRLLGPGMTAVGVAAKETAADHTQRGTARCPAHVLEKAFAVERHRETLLWLNGKRRARHPFDSVKMT